MKNKNTLLIILLILSIIGLILLVVKKEEPFRTYIPINANYVQNNVQSKTYLDTIVMVGLDKLGIGGYSVLIRPQEGSIKIDDEYSTEAFIIGNAFQSVIYTKESLSRGTAIKILAHELIHLQQYKSGKLVKLEGANVQWNGNIINDITSIPYNEREWEKEAFEKGKDLEKEIRIELYD